MLLKQANNSITMTHLRVTINESPSKLKSPVTWKSSWKRTLLNCPLGKSRFHGRWKICAFVCFCQMPRVLNISWPTKDWTDWLSHFQVCLQIAQTVAKWLIGRYALFLRPLGKNSFLVVGSGTGSRNDHSLYAQFRALGQFSNLLLVCSSVFATQLAFLWT